MAYDYEKSKKLYESLTPEQQKKFAQDNTGQVQEFLSRYNAEKNQSANQTANTSKITNTPAATTTTKQKTTNVPMPEYEGIGGRAAPKDRSWDTGNGQYTYNPKSGYYEMGGNQTSTTSSTNNKISVDSLRNTWDSYDYNKQQELLNKNPGLQDRLTKYGITNKQSGESGTVNTPANTDNGSKTKNPDGTNWDYQDNSQERMDEIIGHLNDYTKTNPGLFSDYNTFYNAFIKGKGRTPEQEEVINDFFKKMKKYGDYDNKSSDEMGYLLAHGEPAEDYLSYLKYNDPQRYAEIQTARKEEETKISNDSYLKTVAEGEGFDMGDSDFWTWNREEMGYRDANKDGLDDRLYHEPTEEEKKLWEEDANYEAERLKIQNAYKNLQSDLIDQYPDADLSTIMVLTSDRGNKMLKALDTLSVSQTKVQGMIKYMQTERTNQDNAGQKTIAEIQKNLGMYYDYTPQGMSELAQAQYAAENVTLDQADNGTDTQKQMALDRVLSDYYDKYGSIIQRSKSQVINDVMAYAKKNGVSLSQALENNFLKFLRQKPGFEQLSTYGGGNPDVIKIGKDTYGYWDENGNLIEIGGGSDGVHKFTNEIRTGDTIGNDINSIGHILNSEDGLRVGTYTSPKGYTYNVYANREDGIKATENLLKRGYYGMTLGDAAQKWIGQGKNISDAKSVIKSKGLSLNEKLSDSNVRKFIEAMGTWEGTLQSGETLDDWAKKANNDFSAYKNSGSNGEGGQLYNPNLVEKYQLWTDAKGKMTDQERFWKLYGDEIEAEGVSKEQFMKQYNEWYDEASQDFYLDILQNLDHLIELTGKEFDLGERAGAKFGLGDVGNLFDYIKNNLTLEALSEAKGKGVNLGILSDSDVQMIAKAAAALDWDSGQESWTYALNNFREKLLGQNKYLKDKYKYQSAYSTDRGFKYNNDTKTYTFGTRKKDDETQGNTQGTTKKAKTIKSLGI